MRCHDAASGQEARPPLPKEATDNGRRALERAGIRCGIDDTTRASQTLPTTPFPANGDRALYCAMFSPRDGVVVESAVYEGGFPQIAEPSPVRQLKQAKHGGQIGAEASAPLLARVVADISQPAAPPGRAGSDPHAAMAPPKPPPKVKPPLPTQEEIEAIKEQQRQNQERRRAIEAKNAIDSGYSCKVIGDTAGPRNEVTTQPANRLEQAARAFLRLMRRPARQRRLSDPSPSPSDT